MLNEQSAAMPATRKLPLPGDPPRASAAHRLRSTLPLSGYRGRVFQRLFPQSPTPERCLEAYYLQRTRFERIAERTLRRRQLTEDGNVEIIGPDFAGQGGGVL